MSLLAVALFLVMLMTLGVSLWVGLHHHYGRKIADLHHRHERHRQESDACLAATQDRLGACRQQLLDAQLELKKAIRQRSPPRTHERPAAVESLLLMLDEDPGRHASDDKSFDATLKLKRPSRGVDSVQD